ncbi:MAG: DUF72 domain-containing protein [Coriobacteriia bacterium]|jgi:uncharacterized protein YecE (DUF72 family)|nr:DUF72 domain-containing protein [Coriobacteriia bacterium]
MIERWYPRSISSAEARLRYYSARYDTVEVDSTFYALPNRHNAENWAKRTPEGFTFHVKAYALMTWHEVDERTLHPRLREYRYERTGAGRVRLPEPAMLEEAFRIFAEGLEPLREAGKMGGVLMQFPPYFAATDPARTVRHLDYLESAQSMLEPVGAHMLVEFRHPSWVTGSQREQTMRFLAERAMAYVSVDAPQFPQHSTMPPVAEATTDWAYVRMHGRNRETYFMRGGSAADRYDWLYTPEELAEWAEPVRKLAGETERAWVMFNNCKYDYAPRNAREMAGILAGVMAARHGGASTGDPVSEGGAADGGQLGLDV